MAKLRIVSEEFSLFLWLLCNSPLGVWGCRVKAGNLQAGVRATDLPDVHFDDCLYGFSGADGPEIEKQLVMERGRCGEIALN